MPSQTPDIRYAQSGDVSIAYAVHGEGPVQVVFVHGYISNLEVEWEEARHRVFFERLASVGSLIRFDRRGSGLSDRVRDVPTLETRMDDLRAVMDAAGAQRAILVATFEAASMAMLFAATYPERVAGLALYNPIAKGIWSPDYPFAPSEDEHVRELEAISRSWGDQRGIVEFLRDAAPSVAEDPEVQAWTARIFRQGGSPGAALAIRRMVMNVDVRDVLPSIRVPTLIAHERRTRDEASFIADRIPNARRVELTGDDRVFWLAERLPDEIVAFARAAWGEPEPDTMLATVLFTDIVGSTAQTAALGDRSWADLVQRHHTLVRSQLDRFRGREIDTAGGRILCCVRRADSRDPLRGFSPRQRPASRDRDSCRPPYRGVRGQRREAERARGEHRRACRCLCRLGRSPCLSDRKGPRGGLRARVRGQRQRGVEGRPRRVEAVRRCDGQ